MTDDFTRDLKRRPREKLNIKENYSNQTISALLKFGNAQMEIKGFRESQGLTFGANVQQ